MPFSSLPSLVTCCFQNTIQNPPLSSQSTCWSGCTVHGAIYMHQFTIIAHVAWSLLKYGEMTFSIYAPKEGNSLPADLRLAPTSCSFKTKHIGKALLQLLSNMYVGGRCTGFHQCHIQQRHGFCNTVITLITLFHHIKNNVPCCGCDNMQAEGYACTQNWSFSSLELQLC